MKPGGKYKKLAAHKRDFCKRMERFGYTAIRSTGSKSKVDIVLIPNLCATSIPIKVNTFNSFVPPCVFVCQLKRTGVGSTIEKAEFMRLQLIGVKKLWVVKKDREEEKIEVV